MGIVELVHKALDKVVVDDDEVESKYSNKISSHLTTYIAEKL